MPPNGQSEITPTSDHESRSPSIKVIVFVLVVALLALIVVWQGRDYTGLGPSGKVGVPRDFVLAREGDVTRQRVDFDGIDYAKYTFEASLDEVRATFLEKLTGWNVFQNLREGDIVIIAANNATNRINIYIKQETDTGVSVEVTYLPLENPY